jgi:hypothetical protein
VRENEDKEDDNDKEKMRHVRVVMPYHNTTKTKK